jgi:predicted CXXCH cytochrome family protein
MRPRSRVAGGGATWVTVWLFIECLAPTLAKPDPPNPTTLASWTVDECTACHEILPDFSHPVGMEPSMPVPPELPLEYGRVTCVTCHTPVHVRNASAVDGEGGRGLQSSVSTRRQLCVQCHSGRTPTLGDVHMEPSWQAHLRWPKRPPIRLGPTEGAVQGGTRSCLSCHDGSIATDVGRTSRSGNSSLKRHPVDVPYGGSSARRLVPIGALDTRIRLPDGRVGCESCHSHFSTQDKLLVMSNVGSQLCLSCHDM